jgi:hypothetical protein
VHFLPKKSGGLCLDGTPGAFGFLKGEDPSRWMIHLQGGGWCFTNSDCANRAAKVDARLGGTSYLREGELSKNDAYALYPTSGMFSNEPTVNPSFANMTQVHVHNCDGNSFSGDRELPVLATDFLGNDQKIWYRGARILDGVIDMLASDFGLLEAHEVVFVGSSAGGAAVILHADEVRKKLEQKRGHPYRRFKALSGSGFFPRIENATGTKVYQEMLRKVNDIQHARPNKACAEALEEEVRWRCFFSEDAYAHTTTPIMIVNSLFDQWVIMNIYQGELVRNYPRPDDDEPSEPVVNNGKLPAAHTEPMGFHFFPPAKYTKPATQKPIITSLYSTTYPERSLECPYNPKTCSSEETTHLDTFVGIFRKQISGATAFARPGNGAFLYMCGTHQAEAGPFYQSFAIDGVHMGEAVEQWWNAPDDAPSSANTYVDKCTFAKSTQYYGGMCNPTCRDPYLQS